MAKYLVKFSEETQSKAGVAYKHGLLEAEDNKQIGFLAFKKGYQSYDSIQVGAFIDCELKPTKEGDKWFVNDIKSNLGTRPNWAKTPSNIAKAQDRKEEMIKGAQERKDASIAFFNSTNSAIQVTAQKTYSNDFERQQDLIVWRNWFLSEWSNYEAQPKGV